MKYLILPIIFVFLCLEAGLPAAMQQLPPLPWPQKQIIPISTSRRLVMADGMEFSILEFKNSALPFYSASLGDWSVISGLNNRKVSTSFAISRQREVHFGISLIRSKDWLGDLNEENLKRYVTSLQIQYPNRFKLQNPDTAFAPLPNTEYLLGNPYKLVHYEVISEQDPEQVTDVKDFIAQEGDLLIVLSFECPKPLAARYIRTPDLLLSGICRAENLD